MEPGGQHVRQRTRNPYVVRGLIYCVACDRRMQGQYNHGDAYYRCRFPQEYALANRVPHLRNVYLREDALTDPLDAWLASAFVPHRIEQTIIAMADVQPLDHSPAQPYPRQRSRSSPNATPSWRATAPPSMPEWTRRWSLAGSHRPKRNALVRKQLNANEGDSPRRMSRAEIRTLVTALGDIAAVLRDADPADKAEIYRQLGLRLALKRKRYALKLISARTLGQWFVSEGDTNHCPTHRR